VGVAAEIRGCLEKGDVRTAMKTVGCGQT